MTQNDFEIIRGTGNVFRDLGLPDPELEQLRATLAAEITKALFERNLTVRAAQELTGIAAADFSRIRNVNLGRFTIDRLMVILSRLGKNIEVSCEFRDKKAA